MMGYASAYVRRHLTAGLSVASAGILAVSLVAVPPDSRTARIEARSLQLTAVAVPQSVYVSALEKFISNRVAAVVPAGPAVHVVAQDVTTAVGAASLAVNSTTDPATHRQQAGATALAATPTAVSIPAPLAPLAGIIGIALLFGPIILLVILACPICAIVNELSYLPSFFGIYLPHPALAQASTAAVESEATTDRSLTSYLPSDDAGPGTTAEDVDATPAVPRKKGTVSQRTTSTTDVTETATVQDLSTETEAVTEASTATDSTSEPTKPKVRPSAPRPVVRESLEASEQQPGRPHRVKGSKTATAVDKADESEKPSTAGDSPAKGDSPDGDAGHSE
jgi:hypothetical protein